MGQVFHEKIDVKKIEKEIGLKESEDNQELRRYEV
jgi:hypothetical protein